MASLCISEMVSAQSHAHFAAPVSEFRDKGRTNESMETSQHVAGFASQDFVLDDSARYVPPDHTPPPPYTPRLTVRTKKTGGTITIEIEDNGPGIPEAIKDKIFQPFFTTKPTGQGTGLGLSLSYDIVKAHGGEFVMESEEGIGTTFSITLPFKINHIS